MAIFSTNRVIAIENTSEIEADLSYGANDFGRILRETQENDRVMVSLVLANDIAAAITESEEKKDKIAKTNIKGVWTNIVTMLQKFAAKIKGVMENLYQKFVAFVTEGSKFYNQHKAEIASKDLTGLELEIKAFNVGKFNALTISEGSLDSAISDASKVLPSDLQGEGAIREKFVKACFAESAKTSITADLVNSDAVGGLLKDKGWLKSVLKENIKINKDIAGKIKEAEKKAKAAAKAAKKGQPENTKPEMDDPDPVSAQGESLELTAEEMRVYTEAEAQAGDAIAAMRTYQKTITEYCNARFYVAKEALTQAKRIVTAAASWKAKKTDTENAKKTAENEGFEFVGPEYDALVDIYGVEEAVNVAMMLSDIEAEELFEEA